MKRDRNCGAEDDRAGVLAIAVRRAGALSSNMGRE
jgi:hypothetical protein